ncbi:MAG: virulence RhuM family protein [Chitinophagaceae bacterium]|nr:virulence RhuM family protein [Chitinophagaceae bacterium]MCW5904502.1 virulence RhuM family protein [Chitinophagaceae bacterium]
MSKNKLQIRNSTAEFLIFTSQAGENTIEVRVQDEMIWLTQQKIAELFGVERSVTTKHLKNIFDTQELTENSVCAKIAHTATDGKNYKTKFYNLDAIISVGYRVNSQRATQFRQWAASILKNFAIRGYMLKNAS